MPENIGTVNVAITGDQTQLNAALNSAAATATKGGAQISAAFNAAVAPLSAVRGAAANLQAAVGTLNGTLNQNVAAQTAATAAATAGAAALNAQARAAHGAVTEFQAVSGTLRTGLGEGALRPAEQFLAMIPGVGAALRFAFPVIGALALGEAIVRVIDKMTGLKQAEEEVIRQTKATDEAFEHATRTIDELNVSAIGRELGPAAGERTRAQMMALQAQDAADKVKELRNQINQLTSERQNSLFSLTTGVLAVAAGGPERRLGNFDFGYAESTRLQIKALEEQITSLGATVRVKAKEQSDALSQASRQATLDSGKLTGERLSNDLSALSKETEAQRQAVDASVGLAKERAKAVSESYDSSGARAISSAQDELRAAQSKASQIAVIEAASLARQIALINQRRAAETAGQTPEAIASARIKAQGEIASATADASAKQIATYNAVAEAVAKVQAITANALREEADAETKYQEEIRHTAEEWKRRAAEASAAMEKFIAPDVRKRGEAAGGPAQSPIDVSDQQRLVGSPLGATEALRQLGLPTREYRQSQIDQDRQTLALAVAMKVPLEEQRKLREQIAIEQLKLKNAHAGALTEELLGATKQVPGAIGGALAKGIIDGKGIGKDIRAALAGIGQEMLGDVFKQLIAAIFTNTIATSGLSLATIGNTVATVANTLWLAIKSFAGLLGFAGGGSPPVGVPSLVGERGPELFVPGVPGTIYPSGSFSTGAASYASNSSFSGNVHMHFPNVATTPEVIRAVAKALPNLLKSRSPVFSPA